MLTQDSLVYAAGVGEDVSFELEVSRHFGCRIVLFDPTPKAISYIETIRDQFDVGISFEPIGLWDKTMDLQFFPPADPSHASFSALNLQSTSEPVLLPVEDLVSIAARLGHDHIDMLKLDIEGAENYVIPKMLSDGMLPLILIVEFDQPYPLSETRKVVKQLAANGYELLHQEGFDFTFVLQKF